MNIIKRITLFFVILLTNSIVGAEQQELTIDQAVSLAQENARAVKLKSLEMRKSSHAYAESITRALPDMSLTASTSYMTDPQEGMTLEKGELGELQLPGQDPQNPPPPIQMPAEDIVIFEDAEPTYFKISTTLNQPLYTWGKILNSIAIAKIDVEISNIELLEIKEQIKRDVGKAYFGTIFAKQSYTILKQTLDVLTQILTDREKSYAEGYINYESVLEIRSQLASMQKRMIEVEEKYKSALQSLEFYTGLDLSNTTLVSSYRTDLYKLDEQELKSEVLDNSFALQGLNKKINQAYHYLDIAKANSLFLPDFSLAVNWDVAGQDVPFSSDEWEDTWSSNITLTLAFKMNLFDGTEFLWRNAQAEDTIEIATTGLLQMEEGLVLQTRQAVQSITVAYYTIQEKEAALTLAQEAYKNAQVSFENEIITREQESGVKIMLYTAELEYQLSLFDYESALIELEYLLTEDLKNITK